MPHDASCELKRVAQYYVTLQWGVGRRISGVYKLSYLFFWHTRNQSCTKMSTGFMSFRAHSCKNLLLDGSKSHDI